MLELFDFGKNSIFIWTCYGVSIVVLGFFVINTLQKKKLARKALAKASDKQKLGQ